MQSSHSTLRAIQQKVNRNKKKEDKHKKQKRLIQLCIQIHDRKRRGCAKKKKNVFKKVLLTGAIFFRVSLKSLGTKTLKRARKIHAERILPARCLPDAFIDVPASGMGITRKARVAFALVRPWGV